MSVVVIMEWEPDPSVTQERYVELADRLGTRERLPEGCELHLAGIGPDGRLTLSEVWESALAFGQFAEGVVGSVAAQAGFPAPTRTNVLSLVRRLDS